MNSNDQPCCSFGRWGVTLHSEKDRQTHLTHTAHNQFVEILKPHLDNAQAIDYRAGK